MISIVISNYSYSYLLPLMLQTYNHMDKPKCDVEIIIIDDSSDPDDSFEEFVRLGIKRIKPWFKVRAFKMPLSCSKMNWGRTLNVGVKQSQGNILIINHSDCLHLAKETLVEIEKFHEEVEGKNLFMLLSTFVSTNLSTNFGTINKFKTPAGCSMPRQLFDELGGFDETFDGYGHLDADFWWRLYYAIESKEREHWNWVQSEKLVVQHLDVCKIGLKRSIYPNPHNEERVKYNMEHKIWTVNPEGWGICEKLEELEL